MLEHVYSLQWMYVHRLPFRFHSSLMEPMNFITKDNIYYPFESLVKVHAIALRIEL